jgi:hypothetical protein
MTGDELRPAADWRKAIPLIVLVGLCAYCTSFDKAFVLDDLIWVANDPDLPYPAAYLKKRASRPVVAASLVANYGLGGRDVTGYHLLNWAAHVGAALALFGVVRRTLLLDRWGEAASRARPPGWRWRRHCCGWSTPSRRRASPTSSSAASR